MKYSANSLHEENIISVPEVQGQDAAAAPAHQLAPLPILRRFCVHTDPRDRALFIL